MGGCKLGKGMAAVVGKARDTGVLHGSNLIGISARILGVFGKGALKSVQ